jgi:membrane protease YdiL (CAAX protease family)
MRSKVSPFTWVGLFISLFGFIVLRFGFRAFHAPDSTVANIAREIAACFMAALLIVLVRFGERLPLTSIRVGVAPLRESIRFGCILAGVCGVTAWIVILFTGYGRGPGSAEFNKIPIWLETLMVIRAGVVEELFFRGYAIERLEAVGCGRVLAAAIPLSIFAVTHWTGGIANVIIAFVGGAVLTGFYFWRRDLVTNMIGHGLSDFVGLVVPRFFR